MEVAIRSGTLELAGYLARPTAGASRFGLVIVAGFPRVAEGAKAALLSYPELADRIAVDPGWTSLVVSLRGTGTSPGDFSMSGWQEDISAAVSYLLDHEELAGVWLAGFGTGGSLCVCAAAEDDRVRGVAALASPAEFALWAADAKRFLEHAAEVGVVRTRGYPTSFDAWVQDLRSTRPADAIAKPRAPRPTLLVHGTSDEAVPPVDARALAEASSGEAELRLITGAGHQLRHDPRAIAILVGWLGRQGD